MSKNLYVVVVNPYDYPEAHLFSDIDEARAFFDEYASAVISGAYSGCEEDAMSTNTIIDHEQWTYDDEQASDPESALIYWDHHHNDRGALWAIACLRKLVEE